MTDPDITALVERLRSRHADSYPQLGGSSIFTQAADALEALLATRGMAENLMRMALDRAEKAEAALQQIVLDPYAHGVDGQAQVIARRALTGDKP